jgi:hypothetical protein
MSNQIDDKNKDVISTEQEDTTSKIGVSLDKAQGEATAKNVEPTPSKGRSAPNTVVEETGVNLIPTMSDEEIYVEEKKKKVNTGSLVSLSLLLSVTILVVGFNIISRIRLNSQRNQVQEKERRIREYSQVISGNTEILERVFLYEDVQKGRISTRKVIEHFRNAAASSGNNILIDFVFPGTGSFEFSGEGTNLEDVAKFWYLLSNDEKLEKIELRSFSRGDGVSRFSFTGALKVEEFIEEEDF